MASAPGRAGKRWRTSAAERTPADLQLPYATWLVDDGVPPNMVQRVLGHERSSTTLDLHTRRTDNSARILRALDDENDDPDDEDGSGTAGVRQRA